MRNSSKKSRSSSKKERNKNRKTVLFRIRSFRSRKLKKIITKRNEDLEQKVTSLEKEIKK